LTWREAAVLERAGGFIVRLLERRSLVSEVVGKFTAVPRGDSIGII
jgi:hypothetical protein